MQIQKKRQRQSKLVREQAEQEALMMLSIPMTATTAPKHCTFDTEERFFDKIEAEPIRRSFDFAKVIFQGYSWSARTADAIETQFS